jgi:hypothetical protein
MRFHHHRAHGRSSAVGQHWVPRSVAASGSTTSEPVSVPSWADASDWYVLAEPGQIEMVELGFLHGPEEPELLIQDGPTLASVFTNDAISWKIRHVFGGGFLDYRGGFGAIVP